MTAPSTSMITLTPAQSNGEPSQAQDQPPKSQKQMTKAERREQQERQRAAKAAARSTDPQPSGSNQKPAQAKKGPPATPATSASVKKSGKGSDGKPTKEMKETTIDDSAPGLRIFSHFGLPKPPGPTKGDIHPAIVRLGLQFSEFKIAGANARCIATLTAFKTVHCDHAGLQNITDFYQGDTRLCHSP
jgi:translation initiation factor eIF-2B subunit delta